MELTAKGSELEWQLSQTQRDRIAQAYREAGAEAVEGYRKVIFGMINEDDRHKFLRRDASPISARRIGR